MGMGIFILFISAITLCYIFYLPTKVERENEKNKEQENQEKVQNIFLDLSIGMDFSLVTETLKPYSPHPQLVSEVVLENDINRKIFVWHLDWEKAFIKMVFENDKLIAKEQQGLYQ